METARIFKAREKGTGSGHENYVFDSELLTGFNISKGTFHFVNDLEIKYSEREAFSEFLLSQSTPTPDPTPNPQPEPEPPPVDPRTLGLIPVRITKSSTKDQYPVFYLDRTNAAGKAVFKAYSDDPKATNQAAHRFLLGVGKSYWVYPTVVQGDDNNDAREIPLPEVFKQYDINGKLIDLRDKNPGYVLKRFSTKAG